jgi:hypothetical protein
MCPAGPLRSTGVTPLLRYYAPRRFPVPPSDSFTRRRLGSTRGTGPPRFLTDLSTRAALNHPGQTRRVSPITFPPITGFTISGRLAVCMVPAIARSLPRTEVRNEAESGSLALRLTSSPSRASSARLPWRPPRRLHVELAIHMVDTSQSARSAKLCLAHQREQIDPS